MRDRDFIRRLVERARVANCSALMITLDLQIMGQRHKDVRNGLSAPPKPTFRNLINLMQSLHGALNVGNKAVAVW